MTEIFNKHNRLANRRKLRKEMTLAEEKLWTAIRHDKLGVRFRRQYGVGAFVLDFYCPKCRLAIEVDGEIHNTRKQRVIDKERQSIIENLGIRFLRFTNHSIQNNLPTVLEKIKVELKSCIYASSLQEEAD